MIRHCAAYAELHEGRALQFGPGVLEADATKINVSRIQKKKNTHCGRFLIIRHRGTGEYALEPLSNKSVKKGAPPPPEAYDEIKQPLVAKVNRNNIMSTDSGWALKKVLKKDLKSTPHAYVVHKRREWAKVVRIPMKYLSQEMQKMAATLPTSTLRTLRLKAGDQHAEFTFSILKRNLRRLNLMSSTQRASINALAMAWLSKNIGVEGIARALVIYRASIAGTMAPEKACKDTTWLTTMEGEQV